MALNAGLPWLDLDAVLGRVDLNGVLAGVDLKAVLGRVDLDRVLAGVDLNAVLGRVDLNRVLAAVDIEAIVRRLDIDEIVAGVDIQGIVSGLDLNAIVARVDLNAAVGRVDIVSIADKVIDGIDLIPIAENVVDGIDLAGIIRDSTGSLASEAVHGVRVQGQNADDAIGQFVGRMLGRRRQLDGAPVGPRPGDGVRADAANGEPAADPATAATAARSDRPIVYPSATNGRYVPPPADRNPRP
ncbi:hypothetical protein [Nakamurella sp.]|uniref:hypothetical protein n=1 Tax=Nakamurella sp. TaxID=1869182 RepID=UPI003B3B6B38